MASFRFPWEAHVQSLSHLNKGTSGEKRNTFGIHRDADCLLKTRPPNLSKHIVNPLQFTINSYIL